MTWIELRKPLPIPYKPIHVAWSDGDTFEFQPRNASRMCLPTDWAALKLGRWNQKVARSRGNPWAGDAWNYRLRFALGFTDIVGGSNVKFHRLNDYGAVWAIEYPKYSAAWNWTHDKTNHKYSYEFYLDNDLEETSPAVIYDDDETIWSPGGWVAGTVAASLSEELTTVNKGTSSLKVEVVSGGVAHVGPDIIYATSQDWSGKEFYCFYLYGQNTGKSIWIYIYGPTTGDYVCFKFVDNWSGWKRLICPFNNPDATAGSFDISQVVAVKIRFLNAELGQVWYVDRSVVDVGQWVQVEMYVPDVLSDWSDKANYQDRPRVIGYTWDGAAWVRSLWHDNANYYWNANGLYYLDGSTNREVYGGAYAWWSAALAYWLGLRSETKGRCTSETMVGGPPTNITYSSYYGCLKRFGFAIKMPPDDGQDSSTYGISQCKLKMEVYYDKETYAGVDRYGATTFEFENSTNQYYGLQLITEAWIALFPVSGASKGAEMLFLSAKPTGLEISADEDQVIYKVKLTLPKGTAVYAGSLLHGDVALDSDGDGVPDCLEMLSYQLTGQ